MYWLYANITKTLMKKKFNVKKFNIDYGNILYMLNSILHTHTLNVKNFIVLGQINYDNSLT